MWQLTTEYVGRCRSVRTTVIDVAIYVFPPERVTSITVPTASIPDPVPAYPTACERQVLVEWSANVPDTDFDHFMISGGDAPVTAPTTATSATITITVGPNEGYATRWVDVFTVDVAGNISCNSIDGSKLCTVLSCPDNEEKPSWFTTTKKREIVMSQPSVYPQPAQEEVTIEIDAGGLSNREIVLYDAIGRAYHVDQYVNISAGKIRTTLSVRYVPPGAYSTTIVTDKGVFTIPIFIY